VFENTTNFDVLPPKKKIKSGGSGHYEYYALFEEMFMPAKLIYLLTTSGQKYPGGFLLKDIYKKNPYNVGGIYEFQVLPVYVDSKRINDIKHDKILFNNYLRCPFKLTEEKIKELHRTLIFNILEKYNTENLDLKNILKFNLFSATEMDDMDEDRWENIIWGSYGDDDD
jgi:hypothetical protein